MEGSYEKAILRDYIHDMPVVRTKIRGVAILKSVIQPYDIWPVPNIVFSLNNATRDMPLSVKIICQYTSMVE
jgi:hypothetical protein